MCKCLFHIGIPINNNGNSVNDKNVQLVNDKNQQSAQLNIVIEPKRKVPIEIDRVQPNQNKGDHSNLTSFGTKNKSKYNVNASEKSK